MGLDVSLKKKDIFIKVIMQHDDYGWMDDLQFMFFSTVFQSYQDDERVIMKGLGN